MAANKPDFSLGRIDTPDVGGGLLDFADRQQKQYQIGLSNAVEADKLLRDRQRFAREQELNARQDTEYNREIGLRTARQDLSKEFLTNPYAAKFGSGKETALLDKQVNDYVNGGGVIDDDMARRLQTKYEEARPFREDATNALTSQMVLAGEDPTKATQTGAALGSNLLSRVEQQAAVSANRKIEQDQYDEAAKRNKDALQLKFDIAKANQAGDKDKAELLFKQYQNMNGGGTGGGSSGTNVLMETLGKIGPVDASSALAEGGPIDLARKAGYTESQIARAAGQSLDTDPTAWTWADNKLDTTMFTRNLGMQPPGSGLSKSINIRDIQAPTAEEWASIVPNRAGYRVVDYDPKRFLEGSKGVLPELFGKDTDKPLLSEAANKDLPSSEIKKLVVDKYGDSNFNKSVYDKNLSEVESGGNYNAYNATSKAFGKYQFVPSTINSLIKQDGGKHTIDEVRKSPELQDYYYDKLTKENINTLKSNGVPVNNFTVYMAHNLGPSQTENFFSNEPLTDATKKAIQAQGVEPTREAYTNRFMHKFENTAAPEEKRPTVQKEDISRMTDAERKAYADKLFPDYATEGPVKELFANAEINKLPSVEVRAQMDELNKKGINTKEDEAAFNNLQKQYKVAKTREVEDNPIYKMTAPELIGNLLGISTANKPIVEDSQAIRQQRIANKYLSNPAGLTANEKQWIEGNKTTPNGRKLLESLGIK